MLKKRFETTYRVLAEICRLLPLILEQIAESSHRLDSKIFNLSLPIEFILQHALFDLVLPDFEKRYKNSFGKQSLQAKWKEIWKQACYLLSRDWKPGSRFREFLGICDFFHFPFPGSPNKIPRNTRIVSLCHQFENIVKNISFCTSQTKIRVGCLL